jgi:hypothetical protein
MLGDCPDDCLKAGYNGNLQFTAKLKISPTNKDIEIMANKAEIFIESSGNVSQIDNPWTGLHTSLFYFCCYTKQEKAKIKSSLHNMIWQSFQVNYDSFACNLDHNNETVYLHGLPSNQDALFNLAKNIETTVTSAGIKIPTRETLFHMTLARVG